MTMWTAVLVASALAFALKFLGYIVPTRWLDGPQDQPGDLRPCRSPCCRRSWRCRPSPAEGGSLVVDARLVAVVVACAALALRAPFLLVVPGRWDGCRSCEPSAGADGARAQPPPLGRARALVGVDVARAWPSWA